MNMFLLSLLMHITGLTLAAGTTFIGYLMNRRFWKFYVTDKAKALTVMELGARLPRIIGIGMGLLVLSGFFMMYLTKGVFAEQLWFRIKVILVLLGIGGGFVARSLDKKMNALIAADNSLGIDSLKRQMMLFYLVQLLLFFSIFVLGVFKFN
ncbi:hypothetical protein [Chitinophaga sp. CF418]|uniref:hypothetical protein n=1 Tax=Chitinophaga sp. CF418 TaxID=1855287 RepID=UPI0009241DFE|nr:hypothetical protein [Chitinophaga sp. CF418]SHN09970.1 hypothetical protein SAMN05216311_105143 [Chitinophaga sp. CF418]